MSKIKTICAWCNKLICDGETPEILGVKRVSHGMCKECSADYQNVQKKLWDDSIEKQKEKLNVK